MKYIQNNPSETDILNLAKEWCKLLTEQKYEEAFKFTTHHTDGASEYEDLAFVIEGYAECNDIEGNKVTMEGEGKQRIDFSKYEGDRKGYLGYIWYDLFIANVITDLTATFDVLENEQGVHLQLNSIHVM